MLGGIFIGIFVVFVSAYVARETAMNCIKRDRQESTVTGGGKVSSNLVKQWENLFAYNGKKQSDVINDMEDTGNIDDKH